MVLRGCGIGNFIFGVLNLVIGILLLSSPIAATLAKAGNAYYGKAPVLGTPYISGYEPIEDASGAIIGVYFVGYRK